MTHLPEMAFHLVKLALVSCKAPFSGLMVLKKSPHKVGFNLQVS